MCFSRGWLIKRCMKQLVLDFTTNRAVMHHGRLISASELITVQSTKFSVRRFCGIQANYIIGSSTYGLEDEKPSFPFEQTRKIIAMKAIRYTHKYLLIPAYPRSLNSFRSLKSFQLSCQIHSSNCLRQQASYSTDTAKVEVCLGPQVSDTDSGNEKPRQVWTVFEPLSNHLVTQRVKKNSDGEDVEQINGGEASTGPSRIESGVDDSSKDSTSSRTTKFSLTNLSTSNKKKVKTHWVCSQCGHTDGQWWGSCRSCDAVGTLTQFSEGGDNGTGGKIRGFEVSDSMLRSWLPKKPCEVRPLRLTDVNRGINHQNWRIPLYGPFGEEVTRVLGGGLVPGSLVLVGGDPGVGKSTLMLQIAAMIAEGSGPGKQAPVVYVSGEESLEQIGNRADRMSISTEELFLYSSTDIEDIIDKIQLLNPRALIVDSIQTVYLKAVNGSAGGISQVKECTSALLRFAKRTNISVFLIGHVNKSGDIAGPRVLEHIVDVVLYLEGEKCSAHRLLRSVKNRYGSTDELGVFEMAPSGLQVVSNPSQMFLSEHNSDSEFLAGVAVAVIMDGSRTFLVEIQALCVAGTTVSRHYNGIHSSKADMIISVLMKQAGLKLYDNAIFLNVVSGVMLTETSGDLAVAAAICSSFLGSPIPNRVAFIGEIGLGGELRMVSRMEKRINTVAKLGYKKCIVPKSAVKAAEIVELGEMRVIGCGNLKEVINIVFMTPG